MTAISVGTVSVSVIPDVQRFSKLARAKLIPEAEKLGDSIGKAMTRRINDQLKGVHDARVGINLNDRLAKAKLDALTRDRKENIEVDVDKSSVSRLSSVFSSLAGGFGKLGSSGPLPLAGVALAVPAAAALAVELTTVASGFVAAGAGAASFAALALPTIKSVTSAYGSINKDQAAYDNALTKSAKNTALKKLKQDWANLNPAQAQAVKGIQSLVVEYHKLSGALSPQVYRLFNDGLALTKKLLPDLTPFAVTFAQALDSMLKRADAFAGSAGFKSFLNQMHGIEKAALPAIANGVAKLGPAIGRLLTIFSGKDVANGISIAFDILTGTINGVAHAVNQMRIAWHAMQDGFLAVAPVVIEGAKNLADSVLDAIHAVTHGLAASFGFLPGIGPKLKAADAAVQGWRTSVDKNFNGAIATVNNWKTTLNNAPKIVKLQGNITDLTKKLNSAKSQLKNPDLTKTRRAKIEATIKQLEAQIAKARNELNALNGKSVTTYVNIDTIRRSFNTPGKGGHVPGTGYAMGGNASAGLHWVGERGPELVNFGRTTRVYNANQSKQIAGSARSALIETQIVNVQNPGPTAEGVVDASVYALRKVRLAGAYG